MKEALTRLLTSMKFWTVIVGLVFTMGATLLARYGLDTSTETQQQIAITISALFGILLHAQGNAESGREAAKIAATVPTTQVVQGDVVNIPAPIPVPETPTGPIDAKDPK